ncbi:hypothetical protein [Paracoccus tegillarcae]|uniref:hypothetical protein n=1 Tax=Paracoccus tegillarcae TaxID=1529068 RepID=UPI00130086B6|nr:hypothetical protein [Paracoccus tegillarcae]
MAEPRMKGWATITISALALVAIIAGLLIGGGPGQGRAERRDDIRRSDLRAIEAQLSCLARERRELSPEISQTEACPDRPSLIDPVTETPYRIEQIDDENLRLCASFELSKAPDQSNYSRAGGFDENGCTVMFLPHTAYNRGQ